jgi:hypothetical protein
LSGVFCRIAPLGGGEFELAVDGHDDHAAQGGPAEVPDELVQTSRETAIEPQVVSVLAEFAVVDDAVTTEFDDADRAAAIAGIDVARR